MALILPIGSIICFVGGLLLNSVLIYQDIMPHRSNRTNNISVHDYFWERILAVLFSISQTGLSIAGIVLTTKTELYWLDAVIQCTLQLLACINVRTLIQIHWFASS